MKKLYILFLLLLFIPINIYAIEITVDDSIVLPTNSEFKKVTNKGTFLITSIHSGDTFRGYKMIDLYYSGSSIDYVFSDTFSDYLNHSTTYGVSDYSGLTVSEYMALAEGEANIDLSSNSQEFYNIISGFYSYIGRNNIIGSEFTVNGNSASANLELGTYLIKATSTMIYSPMVGNIVADYNESTSTWDIVNQQIAAKYTDPGMSSTIVDNPTPEGSESSEHTEASYSFGDKFSNVVDIPLPNYPTNATNDTFELDLFEITYVEENFEINIEESLKITDGTSNIKVSSNNNNVLINQNNDVAGSITKNSQTDENNTKTVSYTVRLDLSKLSGTSVKVQYDTILKENATIGSSGNTITNTLRYSTDPYGTAINTIKVTNKIYTYALELYHSNYYDHSVPISNSKFELYKDEALTKKIGELTTDEQGKSYHLGLEEGTYYLKQITAGNVRLRENGKEESYRLNKENIVAKIHVDGAVPGSKDGYYLVEVRSKLTGNLPFTGGEGVAFFTILGLFIIIVGSVYYYKKEKSTP